MSAVRQLEPAAAREQLSTGTDTILIDVREAWEYGIAHLPDARLIPLAELPSRFREIPADRPVIVYCHRGIRSWHAACFLEQNAYRIVSNLAGGIDAWARELDPDIPRY